MHWNVSPPHKKDRIDISVKDLQSEKPMTQVDFLVKVDTNAVSYGAAHNLMKGLALKDTFKKNVIIGISFADTAIISLSYVQGLIEYINEYRELTWYVRANSINKVGETIAETTGENFRLSEQPLYVKIDVVRM